MNLGIDFGTTNSFAAPIDGDSVFKVYGPTPSVFCHEGGRDIIGSDAKSLFHNPQNIVSNVKRDLIEGRDKSYTLDGVNFTSKDIVGKILNKIRNTVLDEQLLVEPDNTVIGVPVRASENYRRFINECAKKAGFSKVTLVEEPVAAGVFLYKKLEINNINPNTILIYDFGGGTLDVSLLKKNGSGQIPFSVIGHSGLEKGGKDCDDALEEYIKKKIGKDGHTLSRDSREVAIFKNNIIEAKEYLSNNPDTVINLNVVQEGTAYTRGLSVNITREELESVISSIIDETVEVTESVVNSANGMDIDTIFLVGGSSQIPLVKKKLAARFQDIPVQDIKPLHCIAAGAAYCADCVSVSNLSAYSYGIETIDDDDDEKRGLTNMIIKDSTIPCECDKSFKTRHPDQTSAQICVFESDIKESKCLFEEIKSKNRYYKKILEFDLDFGRKVEKGHSIDVTFTLDESGVLNIVAEDSILGVMNEGSITVTPLYYKE